MPCVSGLSSVFDSSFGIPSVRSPPYRIPMECTGIWHADTKDSGNIADQLPCTAVLCLCLIVSVLLYPVLSYLQQVVDLRAQGVVICLSLKLIWITMSAVRDVCICVWRWRWQREETCMQLVKGECFDIWGFSHLYRLILKSYWFLLKMQLLLNRRYCILSWWKCLIFLAIATGMDPLKPNKQFWAFSCNEIVGKSENCKGGCNIFYFRITIESLAVPPGIFWPNHNPANSN